MDEDFVCCLGYEVIHQPEAEPPIDLERPLLAQRGTWYHNPLYDKPAITRVPMDWVPGFHRRTDSLNNYDPDLRLIHLHRLDIERCYALEHRAIGVPSSGCRCGDGTRWVQLDHGPD